MEFLSEASPEIRNLMFLLISYFAEFELKIRKVRQAEGIARAKADGKYKGRKPIINEELKQEIEKHLKVGHLKRNEIARVLGVSPSTVARAIRQLRVEKGNLPESSKHLWKR